MRRSLILYPLPSGPPLWQWDNAKRSAVNALCSSMRWARGSHSRVRASAPRRTRHWSRRPIASAPLSLPLSGACDQEVSKRTLATLQKVCEEVSKKETKHHCEPRDVRVSLPRRADESSEVRSSGDKVPTSASLNVEVGEGRPGRLNARQESSSNLVTATWPKRLTGHDHNGT